METFEPKPFEPNGCGPDGTPTWASNRFFVEECNAHDLNYTNGLSRAEADKLFLEGMLKARSNGMTMTSTVTLPHGQGSSDGCRLAPIQRDPQP